MSCDYSTGRAIPCKDAIGGIKAIYLVTDGTSAYTLTAADVTLDSGSDCQIDDVDTAITVYQIDLPRNTASFSQPIEVSDENGNIFFDKTRVLATDADGRIWTTLSLDELPWGTYALLQVDVTYKQLSYTEKRDILVW